MERLCRRHLVNFRLRPGIPLRQQQNTSGKIDPSEHSWTPASFGLRFPVYLYSYSCILYGRWIQRLAAYVLTYNSALLFSPVLP